MKTITYRNRIEALLEILPSDVHKFDRKQHSRTRPWRKRMRRKMAHESRRRNR